MEDASKPRLTLYIPAGLEERFRLAAVKRGFMRSPQPAYAEAFRMWCEWVESGAPTSPKEQSENLSAQAAAEKPAWPPAHQHLHDKLQHVLLHASPEIKDLVIEGIEIFFQRTEIEAKRVRVEPSKKVKA